MKLKFILLGLIAIAATCTSALNGADNSQAPFSKDGDTFLKERVAATNVTPAQPAPAADTTTTTTTITTTAPATTTAVADSPAPAAPAPAAAPAPVDATPAPAAAPAATAPAAPAPADAAPAAASVTSTNQSDANGSRDPSAVIPLIVMDEVPLIDAIKNLARQAGINYMLDPHVNYNVPGPDGQIKPQPTVSLRWENLTADQALSAVLDNNNLTIFDDPKTHIARITVKDPAAPEPLITRIIQLKYASASNMVVSASSIMLDKRSKVVPDIRTSQLIVVATEKEMATIDDMVARLDTPTKQVLIEARIIETSKNPKTSKGVDWTGTLAGQNVSFGNGTTTGLTTSSHGYTSAGVSGSGTGIGGVPALGPTGQNGVPFVATGSAPNGSGTTAGDTFGQLLTTATGNGGLSLNTAKGFFPYTAFLNADGVNAVLSFLNTSADTQVLSTPRAVTLDNEEATLEVTTAQPIFQTTAGTQGSPGGSQVIYTNVGTILRVTPRISANNTISLKVIPEVSDVGIPVQKTVSGLVNQADVFLIRRIETRVLIPSGNTLVMGGLVDDNRTKGNTKVPFFGDIPILGYAFRSETKSQDKKNLIIFVTPTIVQNEDFQPTETTFLKTKVPHHKADDFGAWDSGEPQDWSKLMHAKKPKADEAADADISTTN